MSGFIITGNLPDSEYFGIDPIILRKAGINKRNKDKYEIKKYKKKLDDPRYMDFAINKIAMELTHFLSK